MRNLKDVFVLIFLIISLISAGQEITHNHSIYHAFIENKGQWDDNVLFKSKFHGGNLWVEQNRMLFHLLDFRSVQSAHVGMGRPNEYPEGNQQAFVVLEFEGSNRVENITKSNPTRTYYNYFKGSDPSKWASNVHGYGEAILGDFYTGIDLKLIEKREELKYEFHVAPKVDPTQIKMVYKGQVEASLDDDGNLVLQTPLGKVIEEKPYAYQIVNGKIVEVECAFHLEGRTITFDLGEYADYATLVIDPILVFATYAGSVSDNFGMTATYGYDGTAYSGGMVYGNDYPTPDPLAYDITSNFSGPISSSYGITDVFISRYSSDGTQMLWSTFLGGGDDSQGTETVHSLICDQNNNLYFFGATSSIDFPIQGGYQTAHAGGDDSLNFYYNGTSFGDQGLDMYVAKLSANGQNLMASTYFGGSGNDGVSYRDGLNYLGAFGIYSSVTHYDSLTKNYGDQFRGEIMLDSVGNCIVASCTRSTDFPTANAFQTANAGKQDGVVFKLNASLSALEWSSYYGGSEYDACYSVKIDSSYNFVFVGGTTSSNLAGMGSGWQSSYNGGATDGFVVKLNPAGTAITNASYIGTNDYDQVFFVEIDRNDNVFLLGQSEGGNFPVVNSIYEDSGSSQFIVKLDPTLTIPLNSTVFGNGSPLINISPAAFLVDICGNIYVSGWGANILQSTPMSGMPVSAPGVAFQDQPPNGFDFYLLVIERGFTGMLYGTYIGGGIAEEHVDGGTSRFDKNGVVYQSVCGGCGGNSDFPTTPGAWSDTNLSTNCNNLVFKFDFELIPKADFIASATVGCVPFTVQFDNFSTLSDAYLWDFGNGDTTSVVFEPVVNYDSIGVYQVFLYVTDSICLITDTADLTIVVLDSVHLNTSADIELCSPTQVDITAFTNGAATEFIWSSNPNFTDTLNTHLSDSVLTITPTTTTTYYVYASNPACSATDSVVVNFVGSSLIVFANDSICFGETTTATAISSNPSVIFDTITWQPDSVIIGTNLGSTVTAQPTTTQYLYVTSILSSPGCVVNDSILINVGSILDSVVQATASEYSVIPGSTVTLYGVPSGYDSYSWTPQVGLSDPFAQNTQASVDETTIYTLTVSDGICPKSDTVAVKVLDFLCEEPFVFVPNAFSPDGNSDNDVLYVRGILIADMIFRVYDRWGELVFESTDRSKGWDGTFRGRDCDPDTYDYYLQVTCLGGLDNIIKGNVTLIR